MPHCCQSRGSEEGSKGGAKATAAAAPAVCTNQGPRAPLGSLAPPLKVLLGSECCTAWPGWSCIHHDWGIGWAGSWGNLSPAAYAGGGMGPPPPAPLQCAQWWEPPAHAPGAAARLPWTCSPAQPERRAPNPARIIPAQFEPQSLSGILVAVVTGCCDSPPLPAPCMAPCSHAPCPGSNCQLWMQAAPLNPAHHMAAAGICSP